MKQIYHEKKVYWEHPDKSVGRIEITDIYPHKNNGEMVVEGKDDGGREWKIRLEGKDSLKKEIEEEKQRREREFAILVPGIKEYEEAIDEIDNYHYLSNRMMDDENNDSARPPKTPRYTEKEVRSMYPQAHAYVHIIACAENVSMSQIGYVRSTAGKRAIERILNGMSPVGSAKTMDKEINSVELKID